MTLQERDAIAEHIVTELRKRFPSGTPTPDQIRAVLVDMAACIPYPDVVVEPDPDRPGAVRITAPVDIADMLETMRDKPPHCQ